MIELLGYGWHVNLQKPMCNDLADAQRMLDAAQANDRVLRVMENYLFYEPLRKLKAIVESGEIGAVSGYHMKMVGSSRGGWDVPMSSYHWQFQQMQNGRGILVFDDGWHKLATALWLFGPIKEVRAWIGGTEVVPSVTVDAPTTILWQHENGIRGVWDITFASDMYLRSDYYTNDERWEVTGQRGYARVNRCTGRGIQQPSLEVYADGEMRAYHALDDDWGSSFRDSGRHWLRWLHTGEGPLLWSGDGSGRRAALRARDVREQRGRRHGCRPRDARVTVRTDRVLRTRTHGNEIPAEVADELDVRTRVRARRSSVRGRPRARRDGWSAPCRRRRRGRPAGADRWGRAGTTCTATAIRAPSSTPDWAHAIIVRPEQSKTSGPAPAYT